MEGKLGKTRNASEQPLGYPFCLIRRIGELGGAEGSLRAEHRGTEKGAAVEERLRRVFRLGDLIEVG